MELFKKIDQGMSFAVLKSYLSPFVWVLMAKYNSKIQPIDLTEYCLPCCMIKGSRAETELLVDYIWGAKAPA